MRLLRAAVFTAVCVLLAAAGHALAAGRPVPVQSLALGWLAVFAFVLPLAGRERRLPGIASLLALGQLTLHVVFSTGQVCASVAATRATGAGSDRDLVAVAARLVCGGGGHPRLTPQQARHVLAQAGLSSLAGGGHPRMPGMVMPGDPGFGAATAHGTHVPGMSGVSMMLAMCSLPMLLGHVLAALVAGLLLRRGEAALWRLVRLSLRGAAHLAAPALSALRRAYALLAALAADAPYAAGRRVHGAARWTAARHRTVWLRHCLARRGPPPAVAAA